jgi:outer membrane protein insertion porin family
MMLSARQVTLFTLSRWTLYSLLGLMLTQSCTVVPHKQYQPYKPFVYKTKVNIAGNLGVSAKRELTEKLENQLDDSLKTRIVSYAGIVRKLVKPAALDTLNIGRSKIFMNSLMNSLGYFQSIITDTFFIDSSHRDQYRAYINFTVHPGKQLHIDSVGYVMEMPELQQLLKRNPERSFLKKGEPYSIGIISTELDRLLTLFRNNGYYKFNREDLFAEVDTVVAALIDPSLDPFEQIRLLDSLQKKRQNPTINVVIRQRPVTDSTHVYKFYMGNVSVYPDMAVLEDTSQVKRDTATVRGIKFYYATKKFKLPFMARNVFLRPGTQYSQRRYYRTINSFNQLNAWSNVDLLLHERYDSLPLLDAELRLYPAKKLSMDANLEASRNVSDFLTTGNLFGIGANLSFSNRNAFREAIQTNTTGRFGIELGTKIIQTLQTSFSHNINFPHFIIPGFLRFLVPLSKEEELIAPKTIVSLNAAYTNRRDFFQVRSANFSWGYEFTTGRRREDAVGEPGQRWRKTWQFIPMTNFEYTNVIKTDSLRQLERQIPSLRFAFNDGLIMSTIASLSTGRELGNKFTLFRAKIEQSGYPYAFIKRLELGNLRSFIKVDGEYKHYINYKKASWAFRAYVGYAYVFGKTDTSGNGNPADIVQETSLPFFKAFFAGGPYSMRAWQIRRLGPGSSTIYEAHGDTAAAERFGNWSLMPNTASTLLLLPR